MPASPATDTMIVARGTAAADAVAYLEAYLVERQGQIDMEALRAIRSEEGLSAEKARLLWLRKAELIELVQAAHRAICMGSVVSERTAGEEALPIPP